MLVANLPRWQNGQASCALAAAVRAFMHGSSPALTALLPDFLAPKMQGG